MAHASVDVAEKLKAAGLRPTRQRIMLGSLLWVGENRHVTAERLHSEARQANMQVSMATVYNTLHQFVDAGLLREVVVDGGRSYFDTNNMAHHHFFYEETGQLEDIPAELIQLANVPVPQGCCPSRISSVDVIIRLRSATQAA